MSDRVSLPPIAGLLSPWVNSDRAAAILGSAGTLTRVFARVDVAPSGGPVTLDVRNATGGGGSGLTVTIADGQTSGVATGSVAFGASDTLYARVTAENGAVGLSGWFEIAGMVDVSAALTTLDRVKLEENIDAGDTTQDALLNSIIAGVSDAMQRWMDRKILQVSIADEKYDGSGFSDALVLRHAPLVVPPNPTVTEGTTALTVSTDFEVDADRGILYRVSGGSPISWPAGRRNITVGYDAGYAAVPNALIQAATDQVRHQFHMTKQSNEALLDVSSRSDPEGNTINFVRGSFLSGVKQAMTSFRRAA